MQSFCLYLHWKWWFPLLSIISLPFLWIPLFWPLRELCSISYPLNPKPSLFPFKYISISFPFRLPKHFSPDTPGPFSGFFANISSSLHLLNEDVFYFVWLLPVHMAPGWLPPFSLSFSIILIQALVSPLRWWHSSLYLQPAVRPRYGLLTGNHLDVPRTSPNQYV